MNIELTTWLWLAYLVPAVILLCFGVRATWRLGVLYLSDLVQILFGSLTPVVNIAILFVLLDDRIRDCKHAPLWRKKTT